MGARAAGCSAAEASPSEDPMAIALCLMIEGQEPTRPSLDTWASLTWLASNTSRIRFGPLVCPLTFHHPALLAKRAAAVAELSGGRLDLGIGAAGTRASTRCPACPSLRS